MRLAKSERIRRAAVAFLAALAPLRKADDWEDVPETYAALHAAADAQVAPMAQAFLAGVGKLKGAIQSAELEAAIASGSIAAIEEAIPWSVFSAHLEEEFTPIFQQLLRDGAEATDLPGIEVNIVAAPPSPTATPPGGARMVLDFNAVNPRAVEQVRQHALELIDDLTDQSKAAIRQIIDRSFSEGIPTKEAGRMIREHIGLHARYEAAVNRYREALIDEGLRASDAEKLTGRYSEKLLNRRAETIARTETMRASLDGRKDLWDEAIAQDLLEKDRLVKRWIVTPDDRLCDHCRVMIGKRAEVLYDELFDTPLGAAWGPPLHPNCRCVVTVRSLTAAEMERWKERRAA